MPIPCSRKAVHRSSGSARKRPLSVRSDWELSMGRAYLAAGEKEKAGSAFRNLYFNLPNSSEADVGGTELRKLGISGSPSERRSRADLLSKAKHYGEAAHEYRDLSEEVSPSDRPNVQLALAGALEKSGSSHDARNLLTSMDRRRATPKPSASTC